MTYSKDFLSDILHRESKSMSIHLDTSNPSPITILLLEPYNDITFSLSSVSLNEQFSAQRKPIYSCTGNTDTTTNIISNAQLTLIVSGQQYIVVKE